MDDDYKRFCLKCPWNDTDMGCTSPSGEDVWQCPMYIHYHPEEVKEFEQSMEEWAKRKSESEERGMTRGFEPVCTNDEARDYFKKCGLTYNDITEGDILLLVLMINRELKKSNKVGETSVNTMSLSKKIDMTKNTNGTIKNCYLYLNSHYFTRREAISFNTDGFVGFAGWADDGNLNPLKRAFLSWCDELKAESSEAYKMAMKALEQRWIPVSEKLPEFTADYKVTVGINYDGGGMFPEVRIALYNKVYKCWVVYESDRAIVGDVIAWMPLPEPYKEGEADDE